MANAIECNVGIALKDDYDTSQIKRVEIDLTPIRRTGLAFLLENVFTPDECAALIKLTEANGYSPAMINYGDGSARAEPGYRDGHRVMIDDKKFVNILFSRISKFLPEEFMSYKLVEINERLRFLRYYAGDKFVAHQDGQYIRADRSAKTLITLQMYLNEGFEGGETTFLTYDSVNNEGRVPIVPKTGMVLVFEHRIYHEGSLVKSGTKYTIRTDVLYASTEKQEFPEEEEEEQMKLFGRKACTLI